MTWTLPRVQIPKPPIRAAKSGFTRARVRQRRLGLLQRVLLHGHVLNARARASKKGGGWGGWVGGGVLGISAKDPLVDIIGNPEIAFGGHHWGG